MKKSLVNLWGEGMLLLLYDDLNSFYTFFSIIFAECAVLWINFPSFIATKFTAILASYLVNVLLFAWLKGNWEYSRWEIVFTILYDIVFFVIFAIGCYIDFKICIPITSIPIIITFIWILIREYQDTAHKSDLADRLFESKTFSCLSQLLVVGGPFVAFVICFLLVPTIPIEVKIAVPFLFILFMPMLSLLEDGLGANNIFEIGLHISWNKEYEKWEKGWKKAAEKEGVTYGKSD